MVRSARVGPVMLKNPFSTVMLRPESARTADPAWVVVIASLETVPGVVLRL